MDGLGRVVDELFSLIVFLGVLAIFGVWKLVEIIYWLLTHVSVHLN